MGDAYFTKDPNATLDYKIDWSSWLSSGDAIISSTWTVPSGLTKESDTFDTDYAKIWVSGGTVGKIYTLTNRITTSGGRTEDRSIYITIKQR